MGFRVGGIVGLLVGLKLKVVVVEPEVIVALVVVVEVV